MKERHYKLTEQPIEVLEARIDALSDEAPPLQRFILPGGAPAAALYTLPARLHVEQSVKW